MDKNKQCICIGGTILNVRIMRSVNREHRHIIWQPTESRHERSTNKYTEIYIRRGGEASRAVKAFRDHYGLEYLEIRRSPGFIPSPRFLSLLNDLCAIQPFP